MRQTRNKGFTLIELLIVIAIIAIIAVIAIPRLRESWNASKETPQARTAPVEGGNAAPSGGDR